MVKNGFSEKAYQEVYDASSDAWCLGVILEWTNHRIAKSGRFANFVREPGFSLNSPVFSREKPPNSKEKWGL